LRNCYLRRLFGNPEAPISPIVHELSPSELGSSVLDISDTSGEERYHALAPIFYRDCQYAIVCYEYPRSNSVEKWIHSIKDSSPDCAIVLAGTKIDRFDSPIEDSQLPPGFNIRRSMVQEAFLTSAQTGAGRMPLRFLLRLPKRALQPTEPVSRRQLHQRESPPSFWG
jgi:GTPase SAR1 family protein